MFVEKISQLQNLLTEMNGAFVIGGPLVGKTAMIKACMEYFNLFDKQVKPITLFPSQFEDGCLLGRYTTTGQVLEWKPGVLYEFVKRIADGAYKDNIPWIIFDGDMKQIESETITNMVDDVPTMCFGNGEKFCLKFKIKIIIENDSLADFSPSLLYRSGIVFIPPDTVSWQSYVKGWVSHLEEKYCHMTGYLDQKMKEYLLNIFPKINMAYENRNKFGGDNNLSCVILLCHMIECLYSPTFNVAADKPLEQRMKILERIISYCFMWAFSTGLERTASAQLEQSMGKEFNPGDLPKEGSMFEHFPDTKHTTFGDFKSVEKKKQSIGKCINSNTIFIHSKDTLALHKLIKLFSLSGYGVWVEGERGYGKTEAMVQSIERLKSKGYCQYVYLRINRNIQSTHLQVLMEERLDKKKKIILQGIGRKHTIFLFDDMHLSESSTNRSLSEFVRFITLCKGMYNMEPVFWKDIIEVSYLMASNSSNIKYYNNRRLINHTYHLKQMPPTESTIFSKCNTALELKYATFDSAEKPFLGNLAEVLCSLFFIYKKPPYIEQLNPLYNFGFNQLYKTLEVILKLPAELFCNVDSYAPIVAYEIYSIYSSNIFNAAHQSALKDNIEALFNKILKTDWKFPKSSLLLFTDIFDGKYRQINDIDELKAQIKKLLTNHPTFSKLQIYNSLTISIAKCLAILKTPKSHILFIGPSCRGKKTLLDLVAHIRGEQLYVINSHDNLLNIMLSASLNSKRTIIYVKLPEKQSERFSDYSSLLLNETDPLFTLSSKDKELILKEAKKSIAEKSTKEKDKDKERISDSDIITNAFVGIREYCSLVISMEESYTKSLSKDSRTILSRCSVIQQYDWPESLLSSQSDGMIKDVNQERHETISKACYEVYQAVCKVDQRMSPAKQFIYMMRMYKKVYNEAFNLLDTKLKRYSACVNGINDSNEKAKLVAAELNEKKALQRKLAIEIEVATREKKDREDTFLQLEKNSGSEDYEKLKASLITMEMNLDAVKKSKEVTDKVIKEKESFIDRHSVLSRCVNDEVIGWMQTVDRLKQEMEEVEGNSIITAAMLTFFGVFNYKTRIALTENFKELLLKHSIKYTNKLSIFEFLDKKPILFRLIGPYIPIDDYSILNAYIMLYGIKRPLISDPFKQCSKGITDFMLKEAFAIKSSASIKVLSQKDPIFINKIQDCVRNGDIVVLYDVNEYLDPKLSPLLEECEPGKKIRIDKIDVDYNKTFNMVLFTNLPPEKISYELMLRLSPISFNYEKETYDELMLKIIAPKSKEDCSRLKMIRFIESKILDRVQKHGSGVLDSANQTVLDEIDKQKVISYTERLRQGEEALPKRD